jgi:hypothetical protein
MRARFAEARRHPTSNVLGQRNILSICARTLNRRPARERRLRRVPRAPLRGAPPVQTLWLTRQCRIRMS